jgi:hypothetical protein
MNEATHMRTALLFTLVGLVVQAFCLHELTPGSFLVFALVAVPLVLVGLLLFVITVWRTLRETKGL